VKRALGLLPRDVLIMPGLQEPRSASAQMADTSAVASGQFLGDVSVCTWNSQALFCELDRPVSLRRDSKKRQLCKLLSKHHAVLLQEVHGTAGYYLSWAAPRGSKAYFSPGATASCAGVGVVVSIEFLSQFDPDPVFEEVSPGRAAVLRLRGNKGALDLWTIYGHTGGGSHGQ